MQAGTKRIAVGGLALAVVAWFTIDAYLPDAAPLAPEPRTADGLSPIPEVAAAPRAAPTGPSGGPGASLAAVLVGCFRGLREDGARLTERYRFAADGALEGEFTEVNHDGSPAFHETLRITADGDTWRYRPAPYGTPAAVSFALVEHSDTALRFANPDHDYPRVISYRRIGPTLETRVDGVEDGVAKSDAYSTQAEPCP